MTTRLVTIAWVACILFASSLTPVVAESRQDTRLIAATKVVTDLQSSPDQNVPHWLFDRAYAVAIVPGVIKVGLGIGGRHGSGVLVVRKNDGSWSNPVFINLTGGSFGFQIGVQSTDVLLVFTSRASIEGIVGGKITLGADASVAAGPVGRQTAAATDIGLAQVYSYSRAQGLFAGVALDGSALTIDNRSNAAYYERPGVLGSDIVASNAPLPPESAQRFVAKLDEAFGISTASVATSAGSPSTGPSTGQSANTPAEVTTQKVADPAKITTHPMEDPNPGREPPP